VATSPASPIALAALLAAARQAARALMRTPHAARVAALTASADAIERRAPQILAANAADLAAADAATPPIGAALRDRLRLDAGRVAAMARQLRDVAALPDPLAGEVPAGTTPPSGIRVARRRVPLGVVAIVYEARPNVTAECAALTLKSGNAVVLRGGKEALGTNRAIAAILGEVLDAHQLPRGAVSFVDDVRREVVVELLRAVGQVDVVIPRGGEGLMRLVDEHAKVPVIRHGQGICHVYVDRAADLAMAAAIVDNAKTQRPGVCNAVETVLVHADVVAPFLAAAGPALAAKGVELRADPRARAALEAAQVPARPAADADWDTEFLDLVLALRTVDGLDDALAHIADHGSHHTAAIVTGDEKTAERFLESVDASCVLWNASTRFNDGGELGLGAEMGISTSKLHAYGPMSLRELTAEKLVVRGDGHVRR
jgi:glutamate-5-semialdehyde dehydrogenase